VGLASIDTKETHEFGAALNQPVRIGQRPPPTDRRDRSRPGALRDQVERNLRALGWTGWRGGADVAAGALWIQR
jgi:hypothetical protein